MILEARSRGALEEVLVIASALSVQDVRDRPMEAQQQADQAHAKFDDEKSEFSGYLTLWKWIADARGGNAPQTRRELHGDPKKRANAAFLPIAQRTVAAAPEPVVEALPTHKISNRQYEQLLRQTSSTCAGCANGATSIRSCSQW